MLLTLLEWVQVPLPALSANPLKPRFFLSNQGFEGFLFTQNLTQVKADFTHKRHFYEKSYPRFTQEYGGSMGRIWGKYGAILYHILKRKKRTLNVRSYFKRFAI